ncbi:prolyl oligopeptidase family serine peptidase [Massilia sp. CCM 8693]|uniref:Prolyl oligopeptidase family serine peptidase n=2 Tax=Massilia aquatica TaxID=2609000 RepID=A0ABX0LXC2_9BURK|nr:prolyl oligopeptidase family serine peptidase [Massilia aquatica]
MPVSANGANVTTLDPAVFGKLLDSLQAGTTAVTGELKCSVTTYKVRYNTVGGANEAADASAAIMVPSGSAPECSGPRPVVLYAHGTSPERNYDMSTLANTESRLIAAMFAARGYIVVAPNYVGYADSALAYHPYLDAAQQSNDMIDGLRAARSVFGAIKTADSGKLFLTGYSQGGYVALATQRAMQGLAGEFKVRAVAGMSGPYALAQFGDDMFNGKPGQGATGFLPALVNAGQRAGAGVYAASSDLYEAPFAAAVDKFASGAITVEALLKTPGWPDNALFAKESQPQADGYGDYFGAGNLFKTSYRNDYLADLKAHPCNVTAGAPLACAPGHPLRKLFVKNDLRTFVPSAPLLLCGGHEDRTVAYSNTRAAVDYFRAGAGSALVTEVDVDDTPGSTDPYRSVKTNFAAAKLAVKLNAIKSGESGDRAVAGNYHAGLVPPFCLSAARGFFNAALAP